MKKFAGFTLDQQYSLLSRLGYTGPKQQDDIDKFLSATPQAAMQLGQYALMAQARLDKNQPKQYADGGWVATDAGNEAKANAVGDVQYLSDPQKAYDQTTNKINNKTTLINSLTNDLTKYEEGSPEYLDIKGRIEGQNKILADLQQTQTLAQQRLTQQTAKAERDLLNTSVSSPQDVVQKAEVDGVDTNKNQTIDPKTGQVTGSPNLINPSTVQNTSTASSPSSFDAAKVDAATVSDAVQAETSGMTAAQGTLSERIAAAQGDPEKLAALQLEMEQMEAAKVEAVNPRKLEAGEAIDGSAVDMEAVNAATQVEAAQANPSQKATVKGQLDELMKDFEGGQTPAWAAGAMRQAEATLAARGLGASSMAGQAIIQATMEAAIPIASADAQTYAQFEYQNLSNRQQTVMFAAQARAEFLKQDFDQKFQTKVLNAAKISEIANMNFTAEQQVALENARLAQSANLENMNAKNAKVLADAAAMSQMDMANLSNRQQAQVLNAQNFLQMDLANLSNRQQTDLFKHQANINALLSDQAATNAAAQFNAASENQVNQFFADLQASIDKFNSEQVNSTRQFNVSQKNAAKQFNATQKEERAQFNANNRLVIAQANAKWRQDVALEEFAAQNDANMEYAKSINGLTSDQLDALWQRERDLMAFAFTATENQQDRDTQILLGNRQIEADEDAAKGALFGKLVTYAFDAFDFF